MARLLSPAVRVGLTGDRVTAGAQGPTVLPGWVVAASRQPGPQGAVEDCPEPSSSRAGKQQGLPVARGIAVGAGYGA